MHLGRKRFAVAMVLMTCVSMVGQMASGNGTTQQALDHFDGGTKAMTLYVDKDGEHLSFTLPANAKVQDARLTLGGTLPPVMQRYAVGNSPTAIAGADLDKNGYMDLAVVNSRSDNVSVLLNDGHGRFDRARPLDFMVAHEPVDLVLADLDKDGQMDLATVNASEGSVTVRLTKADLFSSYATYAVGGNPARILDGDLDNDTYPDLVVVRDQFPVVAILYNKGDGTFNPPVDVSVLAVPEGAALLDVNGDGAPDIVLASALKPYSVMVVKNLGGKRFDEGETTYSLAWPPSDLRAADLTGDGKMDLAVTSVQGNITIFPATGQGFGTPSVVACTKQQAAFLADLNSDGLVDMVTVSRWDSTVRTFINRGGGSMALDQLFLTGANPNGIFAGDLDGDGSPDIATADNLGNTASVVLNNGRGRFAWFDMYDVNESDKMVALGDLDGDGQKDAVSTNYAWQSVTLAYNQGKGQFTKVDRRPGYMVFTGGSGGSEPFYPTIADYNGDGRNDVEYNEELSYAVIMMFNDGNGVFREDSVAHESGKNLLTAPAYVTVPVDVDGDNDLDIVAIHANHDFISILLNDGTGHFEKKINHSMNGNHPADIVAEDFNNDGIVDFVTANFGLMQDFEENLTFIRNDGNGNFTNVMNLPLKKGPRSLYFADLNGDNRRDIVVAFSPKKGLSDVVPGEIAVIMADTQPLHYKEPVYYRAGILPGVVRATDINDDNKPDVICLNQGTGIATGSLSVFINRGDGTLEPAIEYPDVPFRHVAFGDLNGDGRDEVVDPVLGTHLAVYRALYYPGHVVLSGPANENLHQVQGLSQLPQEVNLTASVASWLKAAGKDGTGNITYRMNLSADRAGMVRVSGLTVTYKIESPSPKTARAYSEQGMVVTLILLGLLIVVSLSVGAPASSKEAKGRPAKAIPTKPSKGKPKKREDEPGPVIVRAPPPVQVKTKKDDWDRTKKGLPTAKKVEKPAPPKGPPVKVEVVRAGWKPSKQTVEHQKFEKAAEHRDKIKTEKKGKRKDVDD